MIEVRGLMALMYVHCVHLQTTPEMEQERAKQRAQRFGVSTPELEEEKTRKRKERFGTEEPEAKLKVGAACA